MALQTNTLANALAALIAGGTDAGSSTGTSLYIPVCDAKGAVTNKISIADLATVAAGINSVIPNNADFNSYRTPGNYVVQSAGQAATMANIPSTSAGGVLIVTPFVNAVSCVQLYLTNESIPRFFFRYIRDINGSDTIPNWRDVTTTII